MSNMKDFWWHDDGVFRYRMPYIWDLFQPVSRSAREVIEAYDERGKLWRVEAGKRREAWEASIEAEKAKRRRPRKVARSQECTKRNKKEQTSNLAKEWNRQAGRFRSVWLNLPSIRTQKENESACELGIFPSTREPDYADLLTASYYHETFCWEVALRSAFRILDLFEINDVEFPCGWEHVHCPPDHPSYTALVASASYQMGLYFAKAQAMQRAPQIYRARKMSPSRKGKLNAVGKAVMKACDEMRALKLSLTGQNASGRLLDFLITQGKAEFDPPKICGEDAPSWKIIRYINRYLTENGLLVSKPRSANDVK